MALRPLGSYKGRCGMLESERLRVHTTPSVFLDSSKGLCTREATNLLTPINMLCVDVRRMYMHIYMHAFEDPWTLSTFVFWELAKSSLVSIGWVMSKSQWSTSLSLPL